MPTDTNKSNMRIAVVKAIGSSASWRRHCPSITVWLLWQSSRDDLDESATLQNLVMMGAIPAHQLWGAFVEVMCCTQGNGRGWTRPAALFMSPSAPFQKVLLYRSVGSRIRLGATAQTCDLDQSVLLPSLFWCQLYRCNTNSQAEHLCDGNLLEWEEKGANTRSGRVPQQ